VGTPNATRTWEGIYRESIEFGEQAGIDIGWVRFDGDTTGDARAFSGGTEVELECIRRPGSCPILRPTSTLAPSTCPPLPPADCR
jgi:hypothetical protein